jgi:hypothetical protein
VSRTASSGGSTGTERARPPLPITCSRRSPGRPTSESRRSSSSSADRSPVSSRVAKTARSRCGHGSRARRRPAAAASSSRSGVSSPSSGLGSRRAGLALAMAGIGLPSRRPSATRKVKNWFQVDQQRLIDAFAWPSAWSANADRSRGTVRSARVSSSGSVSAQRASKLADSAQVVAVGPAGVRAVLARPARKEERVDRLRQPGRCRRRGLARCVRVLPSATGPGCPRRGSEGGEARRQVMDKDSSGYSSDRTNTPGLGPPPGSPGPPPGTTPRPWETRTTACRADPAYSPVS